MAGLGAARSLCLALLLCIGGGARALRMSSASGGAPDGGGSCNSLICDNSDVTFPLDVEGLLETFQNSKSKLFLHLQTLGINDEGVKLSVPQKVATDCLGSAHFVFVGDCFVRMSFEAFLRAGGKEIPSEQLAEMDDLESAVASNGSLASLLGDRILQDNAATVTHVNWGAGDPGKLIEGKMRTVVDGIRKKSPGVQIVFWLDAMVWAWFGGAEGWTKADERKKYQTALIKDIKKAFPGALLVWDSPTFIDLPLMTAMPPKGDSARFRMANASQVPAVLAAQDREVMAALGVPLTSRWEVSSKYRGLQCDGLHALGHHGPEWNCTGFPAYEELILQSGLQQLCLKHQVPLCE